MRAIARLSVLILVTGLGACAAPAPEDDAPEVAEILVDGLDYSFAVEQAVEAGPADIRFRNVGEVDHEMVLVRLQAGATMDDVSAAMASGEDPRAFIDGVVGILIADPGETSLGSLQVDFEPGRTYLMLCNFTA